MSWWRRKPPRDPKVKDHYWRCLEKQCEHQLGRGALVSEILSGKDNDR